MACAAGVKPRNLPAGLGVELLQEVVGQQGDVVGPLPQGGDDDFQHAEAEEQIAAEKPFRHVLLQVPIGGGDHPDIDRDRLAAADALEGMPFQDAKELGLNGRAHLADFVEHQGAFVGGLELADLPLGGPGKGPRSWPNNSLANNSADKAAQFEANENVVAAGARVVDRPGDQLLAHPALAANEHGGVAGGGPGDLVGHLLDGRTVADHAALHPQPLAELHDLRADLGEVFRQFLAAIQVFQGHGHRVGHGESELQFVGVRHPLGVGRIEMHQAENLPPAANRCANHAGRMDDSLAVAAAERAVAHDVAGQDGLAFAHHRGGQDGGDLVVRPLGRAREATTSRASGRGSPRKSLRSRSTRAGVGLRALGQTLQGEVGRGGGVGGLGQLEGQPAEFGRRPPHLRDPLGRLFARLKESRLPAAVGDRGRTSAGQGVGLVLVGGAGAASSFRGKGRKTDVESANASASRCTNTSCDRPMRTMSPGRSVQSPITRWFPTIVPLRLSRSRSIHWPAETKTSR